MTCSQPMELPMEMTMPSTEPRTDSRRIKPQVAAARLTSSEMQQLRNEAGKSGQSVSSYVRSLILDATSA